MTTEKFLIEHLINNKNYDTICKEYSIPLQQIQVWWKEGIDIRNTINKAKQLFENRKKDKEFEKFKDLGLEYFYNWYKKEEKNCCYCGIEEYKLKYLFENKYLTTKRRRGKSLELERINSTENEYSPTNCSLACYFCNNHKSDIISSNDQKSYFATSFYNYINDKFTHYSTLKNNSL